MERMDGKFHELMAAYKNAIPDPDASPNFMPKVWQKIEARRSEPLSIFRRFAEVCVMTTLALALLMSVLGPDTDTGVSGTYVDALAAEQSNNNAVLLNVDDIL